MLLVIEANTAPSLQMIDQDDSSTSSTLTVELASVKTALTANGEPTTMVRNMTATKRRVSFNESANVEIESDTDPADFCEKWLSRDDLLVCKSNAMFMAKEITKSERLSKSPLSYQRVLERAYDACAQHHPKHEDQDAGMMSIMTHYERKHLVRWAEVATSRLGLERWALRNIAADKNERRVQIMDLVLDLQAAALSDSDSSDDDDESTMMAEPMDEQMRAASERISRASRLFARVLAEAQATAARKADEKATFFD